MKIGSIGSCLSNVLANRMISRFGGEKLFHVYRNRSDQFYHYYIKKDKTIVPRKYVEDNLEILLENQDDPNFVSPTEMLDNQYEKLGKHGIVNDKNLFEILTKEKLDIIILDNYTDMGAILSYPKLDNYETSPIFLRKHDYSNYDKYFTFGKLLSVEESAFYFNEIINYLTTLQPTAFIYFLHYPYTPFVNNQKRQMRARNFERIFKSSKATMVPAATIQEMFQLENDPSHYEDSIYVAYGGFIYFDYLKRKKSEFMYLLSDKGKYFNDSESYYSIPILPFAAETSWTAAIKIYEFNNDKQFNFFLGERGTNNLSILRRNNFLEFRADDSTYVGGVEFYKEMLNHVVVVYDKGNFTFCNNGNVSTDIYHPTSASFNAIGSGYDGKSHEYPCQIFQVSFWAEALKQEEFSSCFDKWFIEKTGNLIAHWNFESKEKE